MLWSDFLSCCSMSFFCSRLPSGYHNVHHIALGSTWLWLFFRLPLFLMTLTVSRSTGQVFCRMSPQLGFVCRVNWGYGFWGERPQRLCHIKPRCYRCDSWLFGNLDHLAWGRWISSGCQKFFTVKLLPSPPCPHFPRCTFLEESHYA